MRKLYLRYSKEVNRYWTLKEFKTMNFDLRNLWFSFDYTNEWIMVDEDEGWVTVWCEWDLKDKKDKDFVSYEEKKEYDAAYTRYCRKRGQDMPVLEITEQNYEQVLRQWKRFNKIKIPYLIFTIDDAGWVRIEGKDKFDEQDWKDVKDEHQRYLNFKEKFDAYEPFRKGKKKEWESSDDDEYYSDFLTEEEMVWKKKRF